MPNIPPEGALSSLTIDCTIFGFDEFKLKILLVKRDIEPSKGMWALPGGWIFENENTDEAAKRILFEATGVRDLYMEQAGGESRFHLMFELYFHSKVSFEAAMATPIGIQLIEALMPWSEAKIITWFFADAFMEDMEPPLPR